MLREHFLFPNDFYTTAVQTKGEMTITRQCVGLDAQPQQRSGFPGLVIHRSFHRHNRVRRIPIWYSYGLRRKHRRGAWHVFGCLLCYVELSVVTT